MLIRLAHPHFGSLPRPQWPRRLAKIFQGFGEAENQKRFGLHPSSVSTSHILIESALQRRLRGWAQRPSFQRCSCLSTSRGLRQAEGLTIELGAGRQCTYDLVFLRDSCSCRQCVDPSTSQRLFDTADIPLTIRQKSLERLPDGSFKLTWQNDLPGYQNHSSLFSAEFLEANASYTHRRDAAEKTPMWKPWLSQTMSTQARVYSFADYMASDHALHRLLEQLAVSGIAFISHVPQDPGVVSSIATRIGPLRNSFYGETWDVRSVASATNVAYTSQKLGFHMDLLYMANPPRLQFLHCMEAKALGGESLFSDSYAAIYDLASAHPACVHLLTKFRTTYHYKNAGQWYQQNRPTFELSSEGLEAIEALSLDSRSTSSLEHEQYEVDKFDFESTEASDLWKLLSEHLQAVNWSPPFQGPFQYDIGGCNKSPMTSRLRSYVEAVSLFKSFLEDSSHIFETRMESGTCVVFDNRRIVHARRAFASSSGERWLRGAYVDGDAFQSRLRVLNDKYGSKSWKD